MPQAIVQHIIESMENAPSFQDLLARARTGESAAMDQLLALIRPWLERVARSHGRGQSSEESVSDVVQEAWLRAWQKLDQFQGAVDEEAALVRFRAWLARIVSRLSLNAARDGAAQRRMPPGTILRLDEVPAAGDSATPRDPSAAEPTPSAHLHAEEQARLVHEAMGRIPDPFDRDIIRLRFFEGISLRQIAAQLGSNHESVRQRYHAAMERLQKDLHRS